MSHLQCDRRRRLTVSFFVSIFSSRMCGDGRVVCLWVGCANIFWQHFTIIFLQIHNKWVLVFGSGDWSFLYRWRAGFVALNRLHEVTKIGIKTRFCCLLSKLRLGFFCVKFWCEIQFLTSEMTLSSMQIFLPNPQRCCIYVCMQVDRRKQCWPKPGTVFVCHCVSCVNVTLLSEELIMRCV